MPRYRKIDPRIWNDSKFSSLSHEAQRMFFFVLTHPSMTALGAFRISKAGMADELGLDSKGFAKPFQELLSKGLVMYDESAFLVFAKNFLKYNAPENPNVIKGWSGAIDLLPECPLLVTVLQTAKASAAATDAGSKAFDSNLGRVLETLSKRYSKPFAKGLANQEQEQEQEYIETPYGVSRRLSVESSTPASAVSSSEKEEILQAPQSADSSVNDSAADKAPRKAAPVPYEKIVDLYNAKLGPVLGMCRDLNAARRSALKSRWADVASAIGVSHYDTADVLEGFGEYFDKIARSDFLMGRRSDGGWHATFDWLIKSSNYLKVFEGNYENSRRK